MTLSLHGGMVVLDEDPPTAEIELGRATVTRSALEQFMGFARLGDDTRSPPSVAPLSFALALRRGHGPGSSISSDAFAIHGGHDIVSHSPITVGETYVITERIERAFGKTGRSGNLAVIERRVSIRSDLGALAAELTERQIVRWRPSAATSSEASGAGTPGSAASTTPVVAADEAPFPSLEIGDHVDLRHPGISGPRISSWANELRDRESLFHDRSEAQRLGYDDLVVPGPLQSAVVDCWLARLAPEWTARKLHMTFRQSVLAGQPFSIGAVVIDAEPDRRVLDILIHSRARGEATASGTVELLPAKRG